MYCRVCGKKIRKKADACAFCGYQSLEPVKILLAEYTPKGQQAEKHHCKRCCADHSVCKVRSDPNGQTGTQKCQYTFFYTESAMGDFDEPPNTQYEIQQMGHKKTGKVP